MFWDVLKIEPTKDKKKITAAYRECLMDVNPEDKPEEFMALRDAYQAALEYAESEDSSLTPVEKWKERLTQIYNDFNLRKQVRYWEELCSDELCYSLDTKMQVEEVLIRFFMENYFISHEVWLYLNKRFDLLDRTEELYETYGRDFVDYVIINGISYEDTLPFTLFEPGKDGEACRDYLSLYQKVRNSNPDEIQELAEQLIDSEEIHPYGRSLWLAVSNQVTPEQRLAGYKELVEQYEDDVRLASSYINELVDQKYYAEAEKACCDLLEKQPKQKRVMWLYAQSLAGQNNYVKAIEILNDLVALSEGDQRQIGEISQQRSVWNDILIEQYEKIYSENPEDYENVLSLAWAYLQNQRIDEAIKVGRTIPQNAIGEFDYYNLFCNLDTYEEKYEDALEKADCLIEVIRHMQEDGTEKTHKRIGRLAEMIGRKGYIYFCLKQPEKGFEAYEEALSIKGEDADLLTQCAQISYSHKDYDRTLSYTQRLVRTSPTAYHGYLLMAYAYFMQNNDRESFDAINRALDLYGGDLEGYVLKCRLLIRNGAKDAANELLEFLDNNGAGEDLSVLYCKGNMREYYEEDKDGALSIYEDIINKTLEGEYCPVLDLVYYRKLCLLGAKLNVNNEKDRTFMLELARKGLEVNKDHPGLMDYTAWLLVRDDKNDEALEIYKKLEQRENHDPDVDFQIGCIYYDDLDNHVLEAISYFEKALKAGITNSYFYLSYCYYYIDQLDKAEEYCLGLREDAKQKGVVDVDSYYRMSFIYEKRKQYDKAYAENEIAIQNATKRGSSNMKGYYNHKVRLLRMMNQPEEAVETLNWMIENLQIPYGYDTIAKIYMQFGMYDKAKKIIDARIKKREDGDYKDQLANLVTVQRLMGNYTKAKLTLFNYKNVMDSYDYTEINIDLLQYDLKFDKVLAQELEKLQNAREQNRNLRYSLCTVAEAYGRLKDQENKKHYARMALEAAEKEIKEYSQSKAIDHIQKARIYICLEDFEKAQQEIDLARNSTCETCHYCSCKDADIFETEILIHQGKYEQAFKYCCEYREKWPDESDFDAMKEYVKKKGKLK